MTAFGSLPVPGGSTGTWGQQLNDALNAYAAAVTADTVYSGITAPDPTVSTVWADTSVIPQITKGWDGTAWVAIGITPSGVDAKIASTYLSTIGTAAANTTAINNALSAAYTAGGGIVILGAGTWPHNGIIMPAGGKVTLAGVGQDATILSNATTNVASITSLGVGSGANPSRPYAQGWTLRDLSVTTSTGTVNAGQVGIDIQLAVQYTIRSVDALHHDIGFRFNSVWECTHQALAARSCGTGGYQFIAGSAGSTPVTFNDCHALDGTGTGLLIGGDANAISWFGGDFVANVDGVSIQSTTARLLSIYGVNFEGHTGTDVIIGSSTVAPGNVALYGTRHFRGGTAGTNAIDFQAGAGLTVTGSYFSNYTNAINQTNLTAQLEWTNLVSDNTTNLINSQVNGILSTGSGQVSPSGFVTSDSYKGIATSLALGIKPGDRTLRTTYGYTLGNTTGVDGDFYFRGDGAAGGRLFVHQAGAWIAIL